MDGRLLNTLYTGDQQDDHENSPENSPENSIDSPPSSCLLYDTKATSTSSPKRSRRSIQKRVVSVPIRDVEGSRLKGETSAPPSDSWAWRKYGQKPIKGSPYPRGYYRCSSSKGCPARKQVERSRVDPAMVVVTYSCEHNHPWPASRSNNHNHHNSVPAAAAATAATLTTNIDQPSASDDTISKSDDQDQDKKTSFFTSQTKPEPEENKFTNLGGEGSLLITSTNQFEWFSDLESTCSTMLESPLMGTDNTVEDADMAMIFSIREEDESFFADLGELPECSAVFRRRVLMEREEEEHRRCSLTPWCGTT